jgi:hypothetical protein
MSYEDGSNGSYGTPEAPGLESNRHVSRLETRLRFAAGGGIRKLEANKD